MATILYARVSTVEQTIDHQRTQAEAAGYVLDDVVIDDGVSGVTTKLAERVGGRRLFDLLRSGDTLVVRWVDRLGRNYEDVSDNIRAFMRRGVVIKTIINGMTFDGATKDPMQRVGIAHVKVTPNPLKPRTYLGRKPSYSEGQVTEVITLTGEGKGVSEVAKQLGLSRATVYRIQKKPRDALASIRAWS